MTNRNRSAVQWFARDLSAATVVALHDPKTHEPALVLELAAAAGDAGVPFLRIDEACTPALGTALTRIDELCIELRTWLHATGLLQDENLLTLFGSALDSMTTEALGSNGRIDLRQWRVARLTEKADCDVKTLRSMFAHHRLPPPHTWFPFSRMLVHAVYTQRDVSLRLGDLATRLGYKDQPA